MVALPLEGGVWARVVLFVYGGHSCVCYVLCYFPTHMRGLGTVLRCGGGLCLRDSLFEGGGQREGVPVVGEGVEISIRNLRR